MVKTKGKGDIEHCRIMTEEEMLEREQAYVQRIHDIQVSCEFVRVAKEEFYKLQNEAVNENHWERYLRCDGLPRPSIPPEMRMFIDKLRHFEKRALDNCIDWTLSVDERTVLSQDIFRKDKTRKTLVKTICPNIGAAPDRNVQMCLDLIVQIDKLLVTEAEISRINTLRQLEIVSLRSAIQREIEAIFDRLTYRVIRMDGVYMRTVDDRVARYSYQCDNYDMDIWGLRNVSFRFDQMDYPLYIATLEGTGVRIQIPLSVLCDNLTLRCIHSSFDMYTENAKSYDRLILQASNYLNAGIVNIQDCLINEWYMQLEIQQEIIEKMLAKRQQYEDTMEIIAEKLQFAAKNPDNARRSHIPKAPKEPQFLPENMYPDTRPLFLEREQNMYMDFLNEIYHPKQLRLTADEVNLRQYILLGGIYSILFVRRPEHTHFEKFNITLHEDGRILHIVEDIVAKMQSDEPPESVLGPLFADSVRTSRRSTNITERSKSRIRMNKEETDRMNILTDEDELPYFIVTIQLPHHLCLWGEPVVCQYESTEQLVEVQEIEVEEEEQPKGKRRRRKKDTMVQSIEPTSIDQPRLVRFSRIARKSSEPDNIFRSTLLSVLRHSKRSTNEGEIVPLQNFRLDGLLKHRQIRNMERFVVPRIISSFKFPIEFRNEQEEADEARGAHKPKLVRRSIDTESELVQDFYFDFDEQHQPERMYPIFENLEHVYYPEEAINEDMDDKNTMYGLLETFDNIKLDYVTNYRGVMKQTSFVAKMPSVKKSAPPVEVEEKPMAKAKDKKSFSKAKQSKITLSESAKGSVTSLVVVEPIETIGKTLSSIAPDQMDGRVSETLSVNSNIGEEAIEATPEAKPMKKVIHWTTEHIFETTFNHENHTVTIKTDRLGLFGFAFKRYEHFPFSDWSLTPSDENPDEVILSVDTFHVRVVLFISTKGVRGYVTDLSKEYTSKPVRYLIIDEPISDFIELRKRFYEQNINIFAEHDACFYIENGYFAVKHLATEEHIYDCMALHCKLMKFYRSSWNRLATRRNLIICMKNVKDASDFSEVTLRITPDDTTFVEIEELCSDDLNVFNLHYKPTWRNINTTYMDLHQAIISMNPHATDVRNRDPLLIYQIKRLLSELCVLSFS